MSEEKRGKGGKKMQRLGDDNAVFFPLPPTGKPIGPDKEKEKRKMKIRNAS